MSDQTQPVQAEAAPVTEQTVDTVAAIQDAADALTSARMENQPQSVIDQLDANLKALATQPKAQPPEPAPVIEPAAVVEEQPPEVPAGEAEPVIEPPAGEQPPEDEEEEVKISNRPRLTHLSESDKIDQNAILMLTRKGMSLKEATERILGPIGSASPPTPEPEVPAAPPEITALESEVADLEAKLDETGAAGGFFDENVAALTKQLSRANARLESAKLRAETHTATTQALNDAQWQAQRQQVLNDTVKDYPSMADDHSPQWLLASALAAQAKDPSHEHHAKLRELGAPRFFADEAAKMLKLTPARQTAPAAPVAKAAATPTPKPAVTPASGSRATSPAPPAKSVQQLLQESEARTLAATEGGGSRPRSNVLIL